MIRARIMMACGEGCRRQPAVRWPWPAVPYRLSTAQCNTDLGIGWEALFCRIESRSARRIDNHRGPRGTLLWPHHHAPRFKEAKFTSGHKVPVDPAIQQVAFVANRSHSLTTFNFSVAVTSGCKWMLTCVEKFKITTVNESKQTHVKLPRILLSRESPGNPSCSLKTGRLQNRKLRLD